MELKSQVCSLEISKRLKELWVKQESLFWWNGDRNWVDTETTNAGGDKCIVKMKADDLEFSISRCRSESPSCEQSFSAFTVAEIGEMLGWGITTRRNASGTWVCTGSLKMGEPIGTSADTEADARGKMLIYLIENNLINQEQSGS